MRPYVEKSPVSVYGEGLFARALGRPADANPYDSGTFDCALWFEGWRLIDLPYGDPSLPGWDTWIEEDERQGWRPS